MINLTIFFAALNQIRIKHWMTDSYAEHKTLGDFYDSLGELIDRYVETYFGIYPEDKSKQIQFKIQFENQIQDGLVLVKALRDYVVAHLRELSEPHRDLSNIADEIEGEFNHTIYKLSQK